MATSILVVDGNAAVQRAIKELFAESGIKVVSAADGYSATTALAQCTPQLVILEFKLPGGSGKDIIDRVRARGDGAAVPFIILTAAPLAEVEMMVPLSPLVRLLAKPLVTPKLKALVEDILGSQTFQPPAPAAAYPPGYPPPPGYPDAYPPPPAPRPTFEEEAQYNSDQTVLDLDAPEDPPPPSKQ